MLFRSERFIAGRANAIDPDAEFTPEKLYGDWVSLKSLWNEMSNPVTGVDWTTHRHNNAKNYNHCVVGSELVDWLLAQRKIQMRGQGVQIGQMLVDVNLIECVSQADQIFLDAYALYRALQFPLASVQEDLSGEGSSTSTRSSTDMGGHEPLWVKQINVGHSSSKFDAEDEELSLEEPISDGSLKIRLPSANSLYSLDLNATEAKVTLSKPKPIKDPYCNAANKDQVKVHRKHISGGGGSSTTETMTDEFLQKTYLSQKTRQQSPASSGIWQTPQQLTTDSEVMAFQKLCNAFIHHENDFVLQLLEKMNLSHNWIDIVLPIVHKVTEIVRPDVRYSDDDMDIREYVHFKVRQSLGVPGSRSLIHL